MQNLLRVDYEKILLLAAIIFRGDYRNTYYKYFDYKKLEIEKYIEGIKARLSEDETMSPELKEELLLIPKGLKQIYDETNKNAAIYEQKIKHIDAAIKKACKEWQAYINSPALEQLVKTLHEELKKVKKQFHGAHNSVLFYLKTCATGAKKLWRGELPLSLLLSQVKESFLGIFKTPMPRNASEVFAMLGRGSVLGASAIVSLIIGFALSPPLALAVGLIAASSFAAIYALDRVSLAVVSSNEILKAQEEGFKNYKIKDDEFETYSFIESLINQLSDKIRVSSGTRDLSKSHELDVSQFLATSFNDVRARKFFSKSQHHFKVDGKELAFSRTDCTDTDNFLQHMNVDVRYEDYIDFLIKKMPGARIKESIRVFNSKENKDFNCHVEHLAKNNTDILEHLNILNNQSFGWNIKWDAYISLLRTQRLIDPYSFKLYLREAKNLKLKILNESSMTNGDKDYKKNTLFMSNSYSSDVLQYSFYKENNLGKEVQSPGKDKENRPQGNKFFEYKGKKIVSGSSTSEDNNCLLDTIYQQLQSFKERSQAQWNLGGLQMFASFIRNKIDRNDSDRLSINDPTEGTKITLAVQEFLKNKSGENYKVKWFVLMEDRDGNKGEIDMDEVSQKTEAGEKLINLNVLYVNYNHYVPINVSDDSSSSDSGKLNNTI